MVGVSEVGGGQASVQGKLGQDCLYYKLLVQSWVAAYRLQPSEPDRTLQHNTQGEQKTQEEQLQVDKYVIQPHISTSLNSGEQAHSSV